MGGLLGVLNTAERNPIARVGPLRTELPSRTGFNAWIPRLSVFFKPDGQADSAGCRKGPDKNGPEPART